MSTRIIPVRPEHAPELARICFEAFGSLHDRHRTPRDFESSEVASMAMGMLMQRPDFVGFAAEEGGKLVGSNFLFIADEVAGVGPITVDPACQARGVGRLLMQAVMGEAERRGITRVRLQQEAINCASISLYTSLGFDWRDAVAVVQGHPASAADPSVRPMTRADLDDAERLARDHYRSSRRNEVAAALAAGMPAFVRERGERVVGYLLPGFFGHGFAEDEGDMLALVGQAMRAAQPMFERILVPLSQPSLFRGLLAGGCRTVKLMNYMTTGAYEAPRATWLPSIAC